MFALLAKHFANQFGSTVGDQMLLSKFTSRIDQTHQFDDALDAGQVAATSCLQGCQQIDCHRACSQLSFFRVEVLTALTNPDLAVFLGNMARQKYGITSLRVHDIGCSWCCHGWQFDIQGFEFFVHGYVMLLFAISSYMQATQGWRPARQQVEK